MSFLFSRFISESYNLVYIAFNCRVSTVSSSLWQILSCLFLVRLFTFWIVLIRYCIECECVAGTLMIGLNTMEVLYLSWWLISGTHTIYVLLPLKLSLINWLKWWLLAFSAIKLPFYFLCIIGGDTKSMQVCFSIGTFTHRIELSQIFLHWSLELILPATTIIIVSSSV